MLELLWSAFSIMVLICAFILGIAIPMILTIFMIEVVLKVFRDG